MNTMINGADAADENANRVGFSKDGFWMTFGRELSPKYTRYEESKSGAGGAPKWNRPDLDQPNAWRVVGYYDFLRIKKINALDELHGDRHVWQQVGGGKIPDASHYPSWISSSDLVLIPFSSEWIGDDFREALTEPQRENSHSSPMLAMIRITLSPAILQRRENAVRAIAKTIELLKRASNGPDGCADTDKGVEIRYFTSLGGPDVVAVALPKNPGELHKVHRLACLARHLSMASVVEREQNAGHDDKKQNAGEEYPGHACVLVEPVLAFSEHALKNLSEGGFRDEEKALKLALTYQLRLDCGHGAMVTGHIGKEVSPPSQQEDAEPLEFRVNWTRHAIEGDFKHLSDLAKVWNELWFSGKGEGSPEDPKYDWRERNLSDSITSLTFPLDGCDSCELNGTACIPPECHPERVWTLTEEVDTELGFTRTNLLEFSRTRLGKLQCDELMGIFVSFCSALYRPELLGAVRDIYPFLMQLGRALKHEQWGSHLSRAVPDEAAGDEAASDEAAGDEAAQNDAARDEARICFRTGTQDLLARLNRAVRNRVEHRSMQGDPPLTHILSHGACKLINAYSVVFWLAAELFRQHSREASTGEDGKGPPIGNPAHFAALVSAGTSGRIECQELFEDFRRAVEEAEEKRTGERRLLSQMAPNGWSSRLLLLDISGPLLLRPELCFACCLHEMAELSEWIDLPQSKPVRRAINLWILMTIADKFNHAMVGLSFGQKESLLSDSKSEERREQLEEVERQLLDDYSLPFVRLCAIKFPAEDVPVEKTDSLINDVEKYCELAGSIEFAGNLRDAIVQGTKEMFSGNGHGGKIIWERLRNMHGVPPVAELGEEVLRDKNYNAVVDNLIEFVPEVIADVGMWCALDHILGKGQCRDQEERIEDLNRVFVALIQTTAECQHEGQRPASLYEAIVLRWVIQAAALTNKAERKTRWRETIKGRVQGIRANLLTEKEVQEIFNWAADRLSLFDPSGLVENLAELPSYAPGNPGDRLDQSIFPSENTLAAPVQELLDKFRGAWKEGGEKESTSGQDGSKVMDFVFSLWAASGEFGCKLALEKIPPAQGENGNEG